MRNLLRGRRFERGLSLVELMISLVLGLLLVGGAITVFMSSRQSYRATEGLGRMQENSRVAFELMARDIREAGGTPCENDLPVGTVLNTPTSAWWKQWSGTTAFQGFDGDTAFGDVAFGTGTAERLADTDAIQIQSPMSNGATVDTQATLASALTLNSTQHGLRTGDLAMVCTFEGATVFQVTSASDASRDIAHGTAGAVPANSTANLGVGGLRTVCRNYDPLNCTNWPAIVARLSASRWFIANNGRGSTSLFRSGLRNNAGTLAVETNEIAENVTDMDLLYLEDGAYEAAADVGNWGAVNAVRIVLTLTSTEAVGTGNTALERTILHTVALRNRTQ